MTVSAPSAEEELVQTLPLLLQKIRQEVSTLGQNHSETLRELLEALDIAWIAAQRLKLERAFHVLDRS